MSQSAQQSEKVLRIIERLENEVAVLRRAQDEPIAVVGLSCRFPGADGPDAYWSLLHRGEPSIIEVPRERWNVDALYDPDPDAPGKMSTRYGGFLEHIDQFDASFFGISPREAVVMDPQQRILLELSWEALENAGLSPDALYGSPSGVFVGVCSSDYCRMALQNVENVTAYLGTGNATSVAAGRLAYTFGFNGPCVSFETACSSALVAVHYAGESLRRGECRVALAASVNLNLAPEITTAFSKARMMAPDGRCKTFDERADGYVRSEGAAVLVLKTLSAARADGDRILAVIRGTALNQDGASSGLTVPNGPMQESLVRRALVRAGVKPGEVDYIEAHGTGTALGDPIEVGALAEVFGPGRTQDRPLLLGSAKTIVGHLEIAAGMAGLFKVILSLQHETIPGYPTLQALSSRIPWRDIPIVVPRQPVAWPRGKRARIAGISAFGFSGTNAHVVVEEPPRAAPVAAEAQPAHLLCLSARTPDALAALAGRYADWLGQHPDATLDAVSWTANNGRARFSQRLAVVANGPSSLRDKLAEFARTRVASGKDMQLGVAPAVEGRLAFLFTGQGSQYAGMGKELHDLHPAFRATLVRCEEILAAHLDLPLREILWGRHSGLLNQTKYTQPALFALEVALANLWQSWGVRPSYVMGHSVGELAAACVAGLFDLEDGLKLIAARGRLMQALPDGGAMAVILAGRSAVEPVVADHGDRLSIAGLNAPEQTVISGERAAVLAACERLGQQGIRNRGLLDVSHAFHSPLMRPILDELRAVAETVTYRRPTIDIISNVTGTVAGDEMATAAYWVDHVLAPVDFMAGVRALEANRVVALLEVGPSATLVGLATACVERGRFVTAASLRAKAAPWSQMLEALATLFAHGLPADLRKAGRCEQPTPPRLALPTYPFQRQRYWIHRADGSTATMLTASGEHHALLGRKLRSAALPPGDLLFEGALSPSSPAYLRHHRVYDKVIVPAAGYVEMALAGIQQAFPQAAPVLRNVAVQAALVLTPDVQTVVQTHFADAGDQRYRFKILSAASEDAATWQVHVTGEIEVTPSGGLPPSAIDGEGVHRRFDESGERLDTEAFYARYAALGLGYSGEFRAVVELRRLAGDGAQPPEILARIQPPGVSRDDAESYVLHPAILDGCFQAVGAMVGEQADVVYLPVGIEALHPLRAVPEALWAHAVLRRSPSPGDPRVVADIHMLDDEGRVVCVVAGLQAMRVDRRALAYATATWKDKLYGLTWAPQSLPELPVETEALDAGGPRRRWLVLGDRGGAGTQLKAVLEARGEICALLGEGDVDPLDKASWSRALADHAAASDRPLAGIVHLWALDDALEGASGQASSDEMDDGTSVLERSLARSCGSTLALVQALMDVPGQRLPRLYLVTRGAQAVVEGERVSAAQAALWGLGRTISLEHPSLGCTCVDVDAIDLGAVAAELLHPDAELQVAVRAGKRHVARWSHAAAQSRGQLAIPGESYRLRTSAYGSLDRLTLVAAERREPAAGEVEIEVCASAINFKDVLYCLGMLEDFSRKAGILRAVDQPLGFECAGRVVRVGPGVEGLAVGDEVFTMAPSALASHVTIDRRLVHMMPRNLSFAQAASIPAAFMTAIYSLEKLARLRPGETVLIHACAGGVGQAAVQIARARGATVFGTASPAKWDHVKRQGVEHVMNSRTLDFADEILRITEGRGVDVVINSLTGAYISRSADVLAKGGRFVEIGKIGIWSTAEMAAYRPDVEYFSFDLGDVDGNAELQVDLLANAVRGLEDGRLAPLPVKTFPIRQAEAGFRHLAQAKNIGKVVLTFPASERAAGAAVRADRSYWITGGLGALGLHIARSLVASGARQLVLSGRSELNDGAREAVAALRAAGAEVVIERMDVSDASQVAAVVQRIERELRPLGGIVHAAGVLDDGVLVKQTWQRFSRVLAPKVAGAWNLHVATRSLELDFFVLFSSIAAVMGAPGQGNYAAANAFLDGLAALRRSQGLPATSINWGPWAAGGMAETTRAANRARFESAGLGRMSVGDNVEVFEHLLHGAPTTVAVADVDWTKYLKMVSSPGLARLYSLLGQGSARAEPPQVGALLTRLTQEPEEQREATLIEFLRGQVASVVGLASADAVEVTQPLLELGFDSLMAVELKNRVESSLGCTLSPSLLFDHPTLEQLGRHLLVDVLRLGPAGDAGSRAAAAAPAEEVATDAAVPLTTHRESFITASDRTKLCVCSWGPEDAPLVLCVHGVLDQGASWDELAVGLVERGYRVVALDLRGHGRSGHHPANVAMTVLDFLLDLTTVANHATDATKRPFILIGHSMGGAVATLFASAYPERVERLILVEPVIPHLREQHGALDLLKNELRYLTEPPAHTAYPDLTTAARMLTLSHGGLSTGRSLKLAQRITEPCDGGLRWSWDARLRNPLGIDLGFSRAHYLALLDGLAVPSMRIYGTTSQFAGTPVLVPSDARLPRSRSVSIAGGHNLHTDDAAALLNEVLTGLQPETG
ncbi:type I polyketide synthase [Vitiosangium sp. GDMCC 1.1324]|uniref:type I polyketide synthase n=1 Tax=Vitiosangium sp. (strain GDMCC 1.1324) TaxID=2138576 RepID=UPI000D38B05D|nr:type I polyketide synthase [Vitiosangium sp. GDMCC 1.1324]PTL81638.1 beta-ketoacyl synthase [Vitiosangium sp. GDMCC 1.1324]